MPNNITNAVTIKGSKKDIEELKKKCIKNGEDGKEFDFNGIIPQPENLFQGNLGEEERKMYERENRPNWYDWNSKNWGTKWGAYRYKEVKITDTEINCIFETAWNTPQPIWDKLVEIGFEVSGLYKDEGANAIEYINGDCGNWYASVQFILG